MAQETRPDGRGGDDAAGRGGRAGAYSLAGSHAADDVRPADDAVGAAGVRRSEERSVVDEPYRTDEPYRAEPYRTASRGRGSYGVAGPRRRGVAWWWALIPLLLAAVPLAAFLWGYLTDDDPAPRAAAPAPAPPAPAPAPAPTAPPSGAVSAPAGPGVTRLAGVDRIATAISASQSDYADGAAEAVVVARSDFYADALAGTPLAVSRNGPMLLTGPNALDSRMEAEMRRVLLPGRRVFVLGGPSAVSPAVEARIVELGYPVTRLAGPDRYSTAVAVAQELGNPKTVLLATGTNFPDALAAGAAAARAGGAVLLTDGPNVPAATGAYLSTVRPDDRFALGAPAAAADPTATPLVGVDRYDTSRKVAEAFFPAPDVVALASGRDFPDALSGGAHIGRKGGPLLLTDPQALPGPTSDYLAPRRQAIDGGYVYGGTNAVSDGVAASLSQAITGG